MEFVGGHKAASDEGYIEVGWHLDLYYCVRVVVKVVNRQRCARSHLAVWVDEKGKEVFIPEAA